MPPERPDPRLGGRTATYNRDEIIFELESFYAFLPHIPPSAIHHAPPGGWPNITREILREKRHITNKTDEAVELLRRLPYIAGQRPWIAPECFPCDYRLASQEPDPLTDPRWLRHVSDDGLLERWPPWVVQLTSGMDREGRCYMLDTTDGTVTKYVMTDSGCAADEPTYAEDDPRSWRDKWCFWETMTLKDQLDEFRRRYRGLTWLGVPTSDHPGIYIRGDMAQPGSVWWEETEVRQRVSDSVALFDIHGEMETNFTFLQQLQRIYREHGWPDDFKGDECRAALMLWWQSRKI